MKVKDEKIKELIKEAAASFFLRESNRTSLITITGATMETRGTKSTILITVYPEEKEKEALDFVKRKLAPLREYVKSYGRMRHVPFLAVALDVGEKNRQKIDELLLP